MLLPRRFLSSVAVCSGSKVLVIAGPGDEKTVGTTGRGHPRVGVVVTFAVVIYSTFWLSGGFVVLAPHLSWTRPYVEQLRGRAPDNHAS